jgi:hypothetical protein
MHKETIKKSCERVIRGGQAHHKKDENLLPIAINQVAIFFCGIATLKLPSYPF